jgi:hypothetical protein
MRGSDLGLEEAGPIIHVNSEAHHPAAKINK